MTTNRIGTGAWPRAVDAARAGLRAGGNLIRFVVEARRLGRSLRVSYLPPLMVYLAAGISGLTAIVGTFFVKDHLGVSAAFLAGLSFWAALPWVLKIPLGHLVDLFWRWKWLMVWAGAGLIAASLSIMIGLLSEPEAMSRWMSVEAWYVWSALLGPTGYVMQDVVADAMTVEAVPTHDADGEPIDEEHRAPMHTTMQTLGRMAVVAGGLLVAIANVVMLSGLSEPTREERIEAYLSVYELALAVPAISVAGVVLAGLLKRRARRAMLARGVDAGDAARRVGTVRERPRASPWMLGGGAVFAAASVAVGLASPARGQEIVFAVSAVTILVLMGRLLRELSPEDRRSLLSTAFVIWMFRAAPLPGPALDWWTIDELGFDEAFQARLSLVGGLVALIGLVAFRRVLQRRSIHWIVVVLSLVWTALTLPLLGMAYGLHEWTAARTGGWVDARTIAMVNTALESPLSQIAVVPMLAWIARYAPERLKATFFAVMVSFSNLSLSASQLATKWLNEVIVITREVRDDAGVVTVPADYSRIDDLLWVTTLSGLVVPLAAVAVARRFERRRA